MSVRRSLAWAFSGQFFGFAVSFAGSVVVARLLSPREMGVYGIAVAAQAIIAIFATFGLNAYVVRDPELKPETMDTVFTVNALIGMALALVTFAVSFAAGPILGAAEAGSVMRLTSIGALINIFSFRPATMLEREMRLKAMTLLSSGLLVLNTALTIAFALNGASYMSVPYAGLITGVLGAAGYIAAGREHFSLRVSLKDWRPITTFGFRMVSVSGVAVLTARLSDLFLGRFRGPETLGLFGRASNLSSLIYTNVYGTATRVVFVQLSKDFRETGELKPTFLRGLQMITAFMWPLLAGLAVLARPAIALLYGERWLPAATPLSLLMGAQFFTLCFGMNWELFVLRDETRTQSRYEITRSFLGLTIFAAGSAVSLAAASLGRVAEAFIGLLMYYPHVRRLARTDPGDIPAVYRSSAGLTVAAVLPSLALMIAYRWSPHTPIALIAAAVALGVGLWLALIFATGHPLRDEIELLARRLLPGRLRAGAAR